MNFKKIKSQLPEQTGQAFLATVRNKPQEADNFFVFEEHAKQAFERSIDFLASPETLTPADIEAYQQEGFLLIAQTIDGDYIASTADKVLVIPVSLYKKDIEVYSMPITDFFIQFEEGTLHSAILPNQ